MAPNAPPLTATHEKKLDGRKSTMMLITIDNASTGVAPCGVLLLMSFVLQSHQPALTLHGGRQCRSSSGSSHCVPQQHRRLMSAFFAPHVEFCPAQQHMSAESMEGL